ncbi:MAG: 4-hydroxy-tetrahydrodipicolinate synthase [Bacteroidales bacterium]|jgi:4-hydroxy-tetrahydrodipicolinate synthase|nr:4-hydroxy-tetrahydrodipicolinate synthase [Bacteroidales bacterium]HOL96994.1 4-hydroxy-tetrahydrodipicolinate synthase [Bacteroidales bacterium]HOM36289.1 4-hydroxy-tetrahydrodipicolinate synthase [Bacteroidales bacterium]HPD23787.1 4-hydroxy-tetrahydrodipicolinate synthase [Bacteroidales bacterium]HRS98679.1 4-hydroxy-tetrahydrodipicolinate synthase [Bacteroidales bacterium]
MKTNFIGTGVALITPFNENKAVDFDALGKMIDYVIDGGVDYILIMGTTAESATLDSEEKNKILNFAKQKINCRVQIMYGIGGNNTSEIVEKIKHTDLSGVQGILSVTPYYNKPNQEGLYNHFAAIATVSPVEVILYNVPGRTGVNILPETVLRLVNDFENITAIKEASGSVEQIMNLIHKKPVDFTVISGDDALTLSLMSVGCEGVISVAANAFPKEISQMVNFALNNNFSEAVNYHYKLFESIKLMFAEGNPVGIKEYLTQKNLIKNELRLPLVPASENLATKIHHDLMRY